MHLLANKEYIKKKSFFVLHVEQGQIHGYPSRVRVGSGRTWTVRLEAIDRSQCTVHRSMIECVYVWKRPREKVS